MIVFILTIALIYLIETILVGVAFYALKVRFKWAISPKLCFAMLVILFALLENAMLPMMYVLDVTFTIGNEEIAKAFEVMPDEPVINLFEFGLFAWIMWGVRALIAGYIGNKLFA